VRKIFIKQFGIKYNRSRFDAKRKYAIESHLDKSESWSLSSDITAQFEKDAFDEMAQYVSDPLETTFEVYSKFMGYKTAPSKLSYEDILYTAKELVTYPKSFERMKKLSKKSQFYLIYSFILAKEGAWITMGRNYSLHAHLEILEIAGYPDVVIVKNLNDLAPLKEFFFKTEGFKSVFRDSSISEKFENAIDEIMLQACRFQEEGIYLAPQGQLEHFKDRAPILRRVYSKSHNLLTILLLLRSAYGEKDLLDLLTRIKDEDFNWTALQIVSLLKNWDEFKDYPLEWSINMSMNNS
jgi:hypothetical protein